MVLTPKSPPLWSILVASHVTRLASLGALIDALSPQVAAYDGRIEVVVHWNRGDLLIGEYRQSLLEEARGEYVSHVDDDDRVAEQYCDWIMVALETRPDYVGFVVDYRDRTRPERNGPAYHSLKNRGGWYRAHGAYYRDVSHLNPMRTAIARRARFAGGAGEDRQWAHYVRPFVRSQVFIDRVLYHYDFNRPASLRGGARCEVPAIRPPLPAWFRYHPGSAE